MSLALLIYIVVLDSGSFYAVITRLDVAGTFVSVTGDYEEGLAAMASELAPIEVATGQIAMHSAVLTLVKQILTELARMTTDRTNVWFPENCVMMWLRTLLANTSVLKTVVDTDAEPTVTITFCWLATMHCLRIERELTEITGSAPNRTILGSMQVNSG